MKRNLALRIISITLCALTLIGLVSVPAVANSAQTHFFGVDSTGAIMPDNESPVIVEREVLTFDISELPKSYYGYIDEETPFSAYSPSVTAEYTFYNPSSYKVTSKLLFPFGRLPSYSGGYYDEDGNYTEYDDTNKYGITVNGERIEAKIRHTLSYTYDDFVLEEDLPQLIDGYVTDPFYSPELAVTKYTFKITDVPLEHCRLGDIGFDVPKGLGTRRIYFPGQNGRQRQPDGDMRIHADIGNNGRELELYVFGAPFDDIPEWHAYQNGGVKDSERTDGSAELVKTETTTFAEFVLQQRSEDSAVSDYDWYNAIVAELNGNGKQNPNYPVVSIDFYGYNQSFNHNLMRWYEYEITLASGERIVNAVTAPMYPAIDLGYEPSIYEYTYLLSPAKTWKSFGELEIFINTPYHLTESTLDGFAKTEQGYTLTLGGLPDDELRFTLSTSETPKKRPSPYRTAFIILTVVVIAVPVLITALILLLIFLIRRKRR